MDVCGDRIPCDVDTIPADLQYLSSGTFDTARQRKKDAKAFGLGQCSFVDIPNRVFGDSFSVRLMVSINSILLG